MLNKSKIQKQKTFLVIVKQFKHQKMKKGGRKRKSNKGSRQRRVKLHVSLQILQSQDRKPGEGVVRRLDDVDV